MTCRRWKSGPYGYTQAKALVYSKYGEPSDVLSYVFGFLSHYHSLQLLILHFLFQQSFNPNCTGSIANTTSFQSTQPLHLPLPPLHLPPPPHPRYPHKPRRHKPNPRRLPLQTPLHLPPRYPNPQRRRRQRRLLRSLGRRLIHQNPPEGRLGNNEIHRLRNLANARRSTRILRSKNRKQGEPNPDSSRYRVRQPLHGVSHAEGFRDVAGGRLVYTEWSE